MADLQSPGGGEGSPGPEAGARREAPAVEVAVRLGLPPGRTGEWVADAAAFDAGGADALWLEVGAEHELDALVLAGALAVVTFRARLVVALPAGAAAPGGLDGLARALGTVGRLCHGRLVIVSAAGEGARLAALVPGARVLARVAGGPEPDLGPSEVPNHVASAEPNYESYDEAFVAVNPAVVVEAFVATDPAVGEAASGRASGEAPAEGPRGAVQRWLAVPAPHGRAAWRQARADAAARGACGVVVPADPRLLDMLRNPDDPGERTDLLLAQG